MFRQLAVGSGVLSMVLMLTTGADAQRHGGGGGHGGHGGSWSGGHGGSWSGGHSGHWGGHDGFSIYGPWFGFGYGGGGYWGGYPYYGGGYYQPYYGGYYSDYSEPYVYSQPYYYSDPYYSSSQPYYSRNMPYSQGYEEAEQGAQPAYNQPRDDEAMIRVLVPHPEARVTFDGHQTQQRGTQRTFMTNLPERNRDYTYTVRATWTEDGREMKRERKVKVRAGQPVTVDFRQDSGSDGTIRDQNRDRNRDNNPDQGNTRDNNRDQGNTRDNNRDNSRDQGTTPPRPNPKTRDNTRPDQQP